MPPLKYKVGQTWSNGKKTWTILKRNKWDIEYENERGEKVVLRNDYFALKVKYWKMKQKDLTELKK